MRIEHITMYVNNLETAMDFFVKYLGGIQTTDIIMDKQAFAPILYPLTMG